MVRHAKSCARGLLFDAGEDAGATLVFDHPVLEKLHCEGSQSPAVPDGIILAAEYYDHLVRDDEDLSRCIEYTINNPVKVGLCERWEDWPASGLLLD
jgi:hypothetical protein